MSATVINVENLSKRYYVGHRTAERVGYMALRDVLVREAHNFTRKAIDFVRGRQVIQGDAIEEFWALKNVSFSVNEGEVIGIIGSNGAGKSTLLKILSRITEPTQGRITLRGRVGSLLEVGTGFHSELTGRENIFLNGAILGMNKREIYKKFDEIVAFAEVERFLDTPVKYYSSGMYVRLAFAVAAHLEPNILIVDEVLAVGDAEFQKKCLGKIDEVSHREGRTTLFVTHNMETMLKICDRAVLLRSGKIEKIGYPNDVLSVYLESAVTSSRIIDLRQVSRRNNSRGAVRITQVTPLANKQNWSFPYGEEIGFEVTIQSQAAQKGIKIAVALYSARGFVVGSWSNVCSNTELSLSPGDNVFRIQYRELRLLPGQYSIGINVHSAQNFADEDYVPNAVAFEVIPSELSAAFGSQNFAGAIVPNVEIRRVSSAN